MAGEAASGTRIVLVAALGRDRALGRGGQLPWRLPDDMARFKERTAGHTVLMGGITARGIGRALPKRRNLVLTRQARPPFPGQEIVGSLDEALARVDHGKPLLVLGGGQVYAWALQRATDLWLTHVDALVEGADAFFPELNTNEWQETKRDSHAVDERHNLAFDFVDYTRIR